MQGASIFVLFLQPRGHTVRFYLAMHDPYAVDEDLRRTKRGDTESLLKSWQSSDHRPEHPSFRSIAAADAFVVLFATIETVRDISSPESPSVCWQAKESRYIRICDGDVHGNTSIFWRSLVM